MFTCVCSSVDDQSGETISNYKMTCYSATMENLEDAIEAQQSTVTMKSPQCSVNLLLTVANSEFSSLENAIKKLKNDIDALTASSITLAGKRVYDAQIESLTYRLTVGLLDNV